MSSDHSAAALRLRARFVLLLLAVASAASLRAGEVEPARTDSLDPARKGAMTLEILAGGYSTAWLPSTRSPKIGLVGSDLRLGVVISDRHGRGWWRGNEEFLIGAFGAGVVRGPGTQLVGGLLGIRHNFLSGSERVVPYFQFTAGLSSNDIYREQRQTQIGGPFEFVTSTEAGVRIRLHRGCALLIEGGYEHISNAHIYRRNDSFNGLGGRVGFAFSL